MARLEFLLLAMLVAGLMALSWKDIRTFIIPDAVTLPLMVLGCIYNLAIGNGWSDSAIGIAVGYASFVTIETLYRRYRGRDGLGRGDAKLMAVAGSWCGWAGLPMIVLVASGTALVWVLWIAVRLGARAGLGTRVPFGPFLSVGIILTLYFSL